MVAEPRTPPSLTLEEYLAQPEEAPYSEYIDGEVRPKPMPNRKHSALVREIMHLMERAIRSSDEFVLDTELRFVSREHNRTFLPDISVTRSDRLPPEPSIPETVPPDFAIEVLSPDARAIEVLDKVDFYLVIGIRAVWLVDPEKRRVTVYRPGEPMLVLREGDTLAGQDVLPGFQVPLTTIFGALDSPGSPHPLLAGHP